MKSRKIEIRNRRNGKWRVVDLKTNTYRDEETQENAVYVGRPSPLGNPFSHEPRTRAAFKVKTRVDAVNAFRDWATKLLAMDKESARRHPFVTEMIRLKGLYKKHGQLTLLCWCCPEACHANVIAELIEDRVKSPNQPEVKPSTTAKETQMELGFNVPRQEHKMNRPVKVAFTGHRPSKLQGEYRNASPERRALRYAIQVTVEKAMGDRKFEVISGMALGVDQDAAFLCGGKYWDVPLHAYVPVSEKMQSSRWTGLCRERYELLMATADTITCVKPNADDREPYSKILQYRNVRMMRDADIVIAVWDGSEGGTANCVRAARKQGLQVIVIDPNKAVDEHIHRFTEEKTTVNA